MVVTITPEKTETYISLEKQRHLAYRTYHSYNYTKRPLNSLEKWLIAGLGQGKYKMG